MTTSVEFGRVHFLKWVLCVMCWGVGWAFAQSPMNPSSSSCRVLDPELSVGRYQGPCQNGLAHGEGQVLPSMVGGASYQGSFDAGRKQGRGRKTFANGDVYEGEWKDDRRNGMGRYVYGSQSPWAGDVYEGQWLADRMDGQGSYQWARNERYSGNWKAGQPTDLATGGQARRAAYLNAFNAQLSKTMGHVCATGRFKSDPLYNAKGWVRSSVADRLWVELSNGAGASWHLVSFWRPCSVGE